MKITNFTGLKKANRLKSDISEIAYFFEDDRKQDFYNINLLDDIFLGSVTDLFKIGFRFTGVNF